MANSPRASIISRLNENASGLLVFVSVGMLAAVAVQSLSLYFWDTARDPDPIVTQLRRQTAQISSLRAEVGRLQAEVQALRKTPDRSSMGAQVASLAVTASDLRMRQQRLEVAIMDDPARALQVPLIRRDLDNLIAQQVQQGEAQRRDVERLYQLVIGLFAALAVSVLAPGLLGAWMTRRGAGQPERAAAEPPAV